MNRKTRKEDKKETGIEKTIKKKKIKKIGKKRTERLGKESKNRIKKEDHLLRTKRIRK